MRNSLRSLLTHHPCQHFNQHFSSAMHFAYGIVALSFIELLLMKLYISFGCLLLYYIWYMMDDISGMVPESIATQLSHLVFSCNFLVVYFLAMDNQFNKTERCKMEIITIMMVLLAIKYILSDFLRVY